MQTGLSSFDHQVASARIASVDSVVCCFPMETVSQTDVGSSAPARIMARWNAWRISTPSAAIIFVFIILFALTAWKPLHLDNVDFPAAAQKTAETGRPVYYRGENEAIAYALYHPPLYVYLLAAWMRFFGSTETAVRLFGMLCALLQGFIVLQIIRALFGPELWRRYVPWFWAVFLLNPYTVQTAGIADIDSTVYGPLLCLALLVVVRLDWDDGVWKENAPRPWAYFYVVLALTLCLWAKLTTVFL